MVEVITLVIGIIGAVGAAVSLILQALGGCDMRSSNCCAISSKKSFDVHDNDVNIEKMSMPPPAM